jgi:DNA-binding winged helix-turn-helix (wHTH) protein
MNAAAPIRIGAFLLNRARGCLEDAAGAERFLRPKSYRLLEVLTERRGELLSKDDLIGAVWPDVIVSDDSLAQCVSEIRRALDPDGARLLRTVPRRGYLLADDGAVLANPVRTSRNPVYALAGALAAGGVFLISSGWLPLARGGLEIAPLGTAAAVMQADLLLAANDWQRRGDNERARALLEVVVAEEPGNAAAWAGLGQTYWLEVRHLAWGGGRREMRQALEMVERAVAIGGNAGAHRLLAEMRLLAPFPEMNSPVDALANARAALAIAPADPDNLAVMAHALVLTGRAGDAVPMIERSRQLNPAPPDWYLLVAGLAYLLIDEPGRAAEQLRTIHGTGAFVNQRWWPGWLFAASLAHAGQREEAASVIRAAQASRTETSIAAVAQTFDGFSDRVGRAFVLEGLRVAGMPN